MHAGTLGVITATEILPLYCVRDSGGTRNLLLQSRTQNAEHQTELVCLLGFVLKIQKRITFSLEKRRLFSSQPSFLLAEVFISCLCLLLRTACCSVCFCFFPETRGMLCADLFIHQHPPFCVQPPPTLENATTTHCWRAGHRPCRPVRWTYCGLGERNRLLLSFPLSFTLSFPLLLLTTFIVVRFFPHLSRLPTRAVSSWEPRSTMPCGTTTW